MSISATVPDRPKALPYPENAVDISRYKKQATVKATVLIGQVHYDEGRQWAPKGDIVLLTTKDAELLEALGQVELVEA